MDLNEKQKRFCEEYVIDLNQTQAAIRAGYSEKTASAQASRLLTDVNIQNYIQQMKEELSSRTGITAEMVVKELAKVGFFDIRKLYTVDGGLKNIHMLDDDTSVAVVGVESVDEKTEDGEVLGTTKKVKIADKVRALELLGKHLGVFEKDNNQKKVVIKQVGFKDAD